MTRYSPNRWNQAGIRESHNCLAYAFNDYDPYRRQFPHPGVKGGMERPVGADFFCPKMNQRLMRDNPDLKVVSHNQTCPSGTNKVAMFVDPGTDYHFYRQDSNGYWSHKPGERKATNLDESGRRIRDPVRSDRRDEVERLDYSDHCMTFCVKPGTRVK